MNIIIQKGRRATSTLPYIGKFFVLVRDTNSHVARPQVVAERADKEEEKDMRVSDLFKFSFTFTRRREAQHLRLLRRKKTSGTN